MRSLSFVRRHCTILALAVVAGFLASSASAAVVEYKSGLLWPEPKLVDPGQPGGAPADAIVLFGGKDLAQWVDGDKWIVKDGVATANQKSITTKQEFGDCQLHLEWATPDKIEGAGQGRGNSGVFLMKKYEVQILDSYQNTTYFDGQAASIYKQHPPLVNASRKPGQWQTYDIIFKAPRFDARGKLLKPATITLLHNGVLVQDHFELLGDTSYVRPPRYEAHAAKGPIELQYHKNPVRFRNIWIRELPEEKAPQMGTPSPAPQADSATTAQPQAAPSRPFQRILRRLPRCK